MRIERLSYDGADPAASAAHIRSGGEGGADASESVRELLERVRDGGEPVVRELSTAFGDVVPNDLRVDPE
jgi:hypothetical protein